jgi:RNA polymerase sigma-70 factor (ECF subfamily)
MDLTDEELMAAYADGSMEAFQTLYERHKRRILGYLVSKLKDRNEAEEVFQTIFAKLHGARRKYRKDIPFLPWLFTIARHAMIDQIRKNRTYRHHLVLTDGPLDQFADNRQGHVPIGNAIAELSTLSPTQRRALELRFDQGFSFDEIAGQMQISVVNSRQLISRAIRNLRKVILKKRL